VRAELRGLYCPESPDRTVAGYRPEDAESFEVRVQAFIGPSSLGGEETFEFVICSRDRLRDQPLPKGFAFQRAALLLERWDPTLIERAIGDLCRTTEGATWDDVALRLSRFGIWEYESWATPPAHDDLRGGRSVKT
jgi:hypothetical protein